MINSVVMILGVFGVPVALLWTGHRLRRRSARWRATFMGALVGYGVAVVASLAASLIPPIMWDSADTVRGLLGYWGLLIAPIVGALLWRGRTARADA